jgi:cysteinyl-tRNA synthetase
MTQIKLFNTLTRSTDEFVPLEAGKVTLYTCGPTVYDYAHAGHWFTYLRWDTLVRALRSQGLDVQWVMNITDVGHLVSDADEGEDKLEKGAKREGKTAWEVAEFYTQDFLSDMQSLNILSPTQLTKATEHIPEQIALIQTLEAKGYTYTIDDGVYYDTSKFEGYASFARLDLDDQQAGARVEYNKQKRNSSDFALWKFSPTDHRRDMEWESPWGKGFPGWHIECSAMAMKYLGETIDIHTGGIDHIQVHHSNEIAQSEAATGKRFANYWLHANHVSVNGEKISKSLGNGIRLQDIADKGVSLEAFRLHVLESHYRSQSKFSWESLEAAQNRLKGYQAVADLQFQAQAIEPWLEQSLNLDVIKNALADDLNTPLVLSTLSGLFTQIEERFIAQNDVAYFQGMLQELEAMLGLSLSQCSDITSDQKQLIAKREAARLAKDWTQSDEVRDILTAQGIGVRDTAHGSIWYRL